MTFQPCYSFSIQMVSRFIKQQDIRFLQKQSAKSDTAPFTTGQDIHRSISRRTAECIHCHFQTRIDIPCIEMIDFILNFPLLFDQFIHLFIAHRFRETITEFFELFQQINCFLSSFLNNFQHGLVTVKQGFLLKITNRITGREMSFANKLFINTGKYFEQRTFTRSVQTDDTDFSAIKI